MKVAQDFIQFAGRDLPARMKIDIHVKVILLVNMRIAIDTQFRGHRLLTEAGEP